MRSDGLTPQPKWRQHRDRARAAWRRGRDRRRIRYTALRKAGRRGLAVAISLAGAMLVAYGAWSVYRPAGFALAGVLLWALQWNHGEERGDG